MQEGLCFLTCKIQLWVSNETMFAHQKICPSSNTQREKRPQAPSHPRPRAPPPSHLG